MNPVVTPPAEKQYRHLHLPLASGGWAGRCGLHCLKTRPECPKGNLRELTWASEPDRGIAATRKALT